MNAVVFYSNTGQSKTIAAYFANQLGYPLADIETKCAEHYRNLVLVFPVHCQNIPDIVKSFLKNVSVENLTAMLETYGEQIASIIIGPYDFSIMIGEPGNTLGENCQEYFKKIFDIMQFNTSFRIIGTDIMLNIFQYFR